jgi:hypothetical protein
MTKEEYLKFHEDFCKQMTEITRRKNADYTGTNPDPFANFQKAELMDVCSTEQGFLVRMSDKFSRIASFVQKGILEVKDESVTDTLIDMSNYCALMAGYIKSKREGKPANIIHDSAYDEWCLEGQFKQEPITSYVDSKFFPSLNIHKVEVPTNLKPKGKNASSGKPKNKKT